MSYIRIWSELNPHPNLSFCFGSFISQMPRQESADTDQLISAHQGQTFSLKLLYCNPGIVEVTTIGRVFPCAWAHNDTLYPLKFTKFKLTKLPHIIRSSPIVVIKIRLEIKSLFYIDRTGGP